MLAYRSSRLQGERIQRFGHGPAGRNETEWCCSFVERQEVVEKARRGEDGR